MTIRIFNIHQLKSIENRVNKSDQVLPFKSLYSKEEREITVNVPLGFPGGSDGKEFACNEGNLGSIPGQERSLEEGMAAHSNIPAWRIPMDRRAWWATFHGVAKSWRRLSD